MGGLAVVICCSSEHLRLDTSLGKAVCDFGDQLGHLNRSFLVGTFLVEELEHLSDERLTQLKLYANLLVFFHQELLPQLQFLKG